MYKIPKYVNKYVDIRASGEYNVHARPAQKQNAVCFTCIIALAPGFRQQRGYPWIAFPDGAVTHFNPFFRSYSNSCWVCAKQTSVSSFLAWSEHSFPAYCHVGLSFNPVVLCLLPLILRVFSENGIICLLSAQILFISCWNIFLTDSKFFWNWQHFP